ncbi:hypothetical protein ACP4OV_022063 [Aristida adscensionis]
MSPPEPEAGGPAARLRRRALGERGMAGESRWRERFLDLVREAEERCVGARNDALALGALVAVDVAAAPRTRGRLRGLVWVLEGVSDGFAEAIACMEAAELVALRGAAADPTVPLASIQEIPGGDLLRAMDELQQARNGAVNTCTCLERCRGHLFTVVEMLLYHPALPGVAGFVDAERAAAEDSLFVAQQLAADCTALATFARQSTQRFIG